MYSKVDYNRVGRMILNHRIRARFENRAEDTRALSLKIFLSVVRFFLNPVLG